MPRRAALGDLLVLDVPEEIPGPPCARLLGDLGAEVIQVEPPRGDPARAMPPSFQDDPHPETSLVFLPANLNKRGVTLDLQTPEGAAVFRRLARRADVVGETFWGHGSPTRSSPWSSARSLPAPSTPPTSCGPWWTCLPGPPPRSRSV